MLMRVLGGGEVSRGEVEDLEFEATGALLTALNEAYIRLLELAFDHDARLTNSQLDRAMRVDLQETLNKIVRASGNS